MNYPKASEWPVSDLMQSVNVVRGITDGIAEHTIMTLMLGEPVADYRQPTPEMSGVLGQFKSDVTEEEFLHHIETLEVLFTVGTEMLGGFRQACVNSGLMSPSLPDPDTTQVPDSVDDIDW